MFIIIDIALLVPSFWLFDKPELLFIFGVPFTVVAVVELINRNINPEYKVTWLIVLVALPYVGVVLYILFSRRRISRAEARIFSEIAPIIASRRRELDSGQILEELNRECPDAAAKARTVINDDFLSELHRDTESEYFEGGADMLAAMKRELASAKRYIFLEYFIIEGGVMWDSIFAILRERAASGVEVRLLYDDVGCMSTLPADFDKKMAACGISSARFARITPIATAVHNNRDHRKLMIIDGECAFTGGVNIADEYIGERIRFGEWKDGGIMVRGGAARTMCELFITMWDMTVKSLSDYDALLPKCRDFMGDGGYYLPFGSGPMPIYRRPVGKNLLLSVINQAKKYVYITTPYLIIDFDLTEALRNAALRGVDVVIITPGVADKRVVKIMTKSSYRHLMDGGVKIYEFTPGFIHEKLVLSDGIIAVVGTVNLDYRSLVHHFENGILIANSPTVDRMREGFLKTLSRSHRVDSAGARLGFIEWVFKIGIRIFAPLL